MPVLLLLWILGLRVYDFLVRTLETRQRSRLVREVSLEGVKSAFGLGRCIATVYISITGKREPGQLVGSLAMVGATTAHNAPARRGVTDNRPSDIIDVDAVG